MEKFTDKVAIITGAANGIGRGIAERCARENMKVVLADIDEAMLVEVESDLRKFSKNVIAVKTDVTKYEDVKAMARVALDAFGGIHLLCNNAGLSTYKRSWQMTIPDWEWVIGVNLWGVIYGMNVCLPIMLNQNEEAAIVNTSSEAGIIGGRRNMAGYYATKTAVIALSESVYHELAESTQQVHISVYIPGLVRSNAWDPDRYRPPRLLNEDTDQDADQLAAKYEEFKRRSRALFESEYAMDTSQAVDILFKGIRENKFYIRTHEGSKNELIRARIEDLLAGSNPVDRIPQEREKMGITQN